MQRRLVGFDVRVGNAADDLADLRQAAVDGLEHFQRVVVGDVQGALDLPVGGVVGRDPGNRRGKAEQRNGQRQRGGHHPLQQSQRIALLGLHGRSDSVAELTAKFWAEQSWRGGTPWEPAWRAAQSGTISQSACTVPDCAPLHPCYIASLVDVLNSAPYPD